MLKTTDITLLNVKNVTNYLLADTHYNIKTCLPFYTYMSVGQIDYQNAPPCKHINTMTINRNLE